MDHNRIEISADVLSAVQTIEEWFKLNGYKKGRIGHLTFDADIPDKKDDPSNSTGDIFVCLSTDVGPIRYKDVSSALKKNPSTTIEWIAISNNTPGSSASTLDVVVCQMQSSGDGYPEWKFSKESLAFTSRDNEQTLRNMNLLGPDVYVNRIGLIYIRDDDDTQ
jgi:hypothetical protein